MNSGSDELGAPEKLSSEHDRSGSDSGEVLLDE